MDRPRVIFIPVLSLIALFLALPVSGRVKKVDCEISLTQLHGRTSYPLPEWFFRGKAPRPSPVDRFDRSQVKGWVEAQPADARFIFDFAQTHLTRITQKEFETELYKNFKQFLAKRDGKKPLLFLLPSDARTKSQTWVAALLREKFPEQMKDAHFLTYGSADSPISKHQALLTSGRYEIVFADDALYSGTQAATTEELISILISTVPVSVVAPFSTTKARDRLAAKANVTFYTSQLIPSVEELVAANPLPNSLTEKQRVNFYKILRADQSLTYFDHKKPDAMSLPRPVGDGMVFFTLPNGVLEECPLEPNHPLFPTAPVHQRVPLFREINPPYK